MVEGGTLFWLVVGASLLGLVTRVAIPPAAWLALTFLLHASRSMPLVPGLAYMWLALFVALAVGNRHVLAVPGPPYFAVIGFLATTVLVAFAADRLAVSRFDGLGATLIFPMAWVALEFLRSRLTPLATWGSIAYTQYGFLPLTQVASLVGIWGITFLIAWFAATCDWAWGHGFEWSVVRVPVVTYAAVLGAIVLGGTVRIVRAPTDRATLRAATLSRPADLFDAAEISRITEDRVSPDARAQVIQKLTRLHDWFLEGSRREARAGARLIVWPEENLLIFEADEAAFLARAQRLAAEEQIYLAMGMGTVHRGERLPLENKLVMIDPSGRILASYLKNHPVAGWETRIMRLGDGRVPVIATPEGRFAMAICFDADFPDFMRQAGVGLADLLILPANDWKEIKHLHFQMASFRAIENGAPLVRPASAGVSSAFDQWGRVLGIADDFAPSDRTLTVQLPVGRVATLYTKTGDLFAWLCMAGLVAAAAIAALS